jgi:hypothetical protein
LAAAGLPAEPEIQEPGLAQLPEGDTSPAASGSRNREDGEIRSEGEDIEDVDADLKDLGSKAVESSPCNLCFRGI